MNWKNYPYLLLILGLFFINLNVFAQKNKLWVKIEALDGNEKILIGNITTKQHQLFSLDVDQLKNELRFSKKNNNAAEVIELPDAEGNFVKFKIYETAILHPELAKKHPSIKSYNGQGLNDASLKIYLSTTKLGLHAMILSPKKGTLFIDPYTVNRKKYKVYYKKDALVDKSFECLTEGIVTEDEIIKTKSSILKSFQQDLKLRTFRLALAATEEYSNFHVNAAGLGSNSTRADSINVVLSAMVVTMSRVVSIFERDVALTMQLVPNNDQLIFLQTDPGNDPYTNDNGPAMLLQNKNTVNNIIGPSNYDIGHVLSTGGGGVVTKASACGSNKAQGVTGSELPVGDSFDVDYVAHEMGHQFGANHVFNGLEGSCGNSNNRNIATAVEPGSGSSLMGYAGICGQQNIQTNSDSYFNNISIAEIYDNITNGSSQCAAVSNFSTNMNMPSANAGSDYTIPKSTPFVLRGQGSDADGDVLTYCWEQMDNEVTGISFPPSSTQTGGAVFRSFPPSLKSNRFFPNIESLAFDVNSTWEVLPSVSRAMNFALTVRDNATGEGQSADDRMVITVNDAAGPFVVTSQNNASISWTENNTETITWDVAGTDSNGINVSNVNILLSTDGGLTYPTVLVANTPNDGSENIIVPNTPSPNARVMVEAIDNVFFAINSENISIGNFQTSCTTYPSLDAVKAIPDGSITGVISTINISDNFLVSDVNVTLDIAHTYLWDLQIYLKAPNGTEVLIYNRTCGSSADGRVNINATFDDAANTVVCGTSSPAISGNTKPTNLLSTFNGSNAIGNWQLKVVDNSPGDTGLLNSWSLELCETNQTVSVNDYDFNLFTIYPNPTKGQVELKLNASNSEDVQVGLYDFSGRQVFTAIYTSVDLNFNEAIDLSHLAKGVYFIKVNKGKASGTKKVILY